ncbi:hypothetical protein PV682_24995 [Streptomyces niveiscabiei]|nr:hypothetical protein [Streptomyces niveiscabiei]MDX3384700.1 hypothetical protein [Streptomyces niveiscabiei]
MIRLTTPAGDLAGVLPRREGAPGTAFFRAQAWSHLIELPEGTWGAGGSVIRCADLVALARRERAGA